jgi:hypothetical protein
MQRNLLRDNALESEQPALFGPAVAEQHASIH